MHTTHGLMKTIHQRVEAMKAWETQHPGLAAAWNAALLEDEERTERAQRIREEQERARHLRQTAPDRLLRLGAPERAVRAWDGGLATTKALEAVQAALGGSRNFLLLSGGKGVGKTVAAVAGMAMRLLEGRREDVPALFVRAEEGAQLGLYDAQDKKLKLQMQDAGVLVLDDLGTEFFTKGGVWHTILDGVIDVRYGSGAPTIITTNLPFDAFKERYGARIEDRIGHSGLCVALGEGSLRKRGGG